MKSNILKQNRIPTYATLVAVALTSAQLASAASVTIVNEDFADIPVETLLNGQTADTFDSGITTAGGSSTWAANANITETGTIGLAGTGVSAYLNMGSYIDDTKGTASGFFTATAELNISAGSWIGFGFFASNTPSINANFIADSASAFTLYRNGGTVDGFAIGTANNVDGGTTVYTSPTLFTIELDLTNHDNSSDFGTVTYYAGATNLGSYSYTADISFGAFGLTSTNNGNVSSADSLTLTQQVPEPSSAALLGLGGLALILRRRK